MDRGTEVPHPPPMIDDVATRSYAATAGRAPAVSRYRWRICALLFAATTLNYIDRQVLAVLAPELTRIFGWTEIEYGNIVRAFQGAYALGLLGAGVLVDRLGTRIGYALAIAVWSVSAMSHALARTVMQFTLARFALGLGESGNFPTAIKTVAEWFPRRERAFATGLFNAGSNFGAVLAPLIVPFVATRWGWQYAFLFTGVLSAAWLMTWLLSYRSPTRHAGVAAAELAYIQSDPPEPAIPLPWSQLLRHRQAWSFVAAKFLTDPVWWFLLFWLPKFLNSTYGLSLVELGPPLIVIYLMADVGSILGGWLSNALIRRGWTVNRARKTAMLVCAVAVVPIVFAVFVKSLWAAVALIGLATAAHQGWSANVYTLTSDMFPRRAVGSVVGLGAFAGAIGGMLIATLTGFILQTTGSYVPLFALAACMYLIALAVVHWLVPRLEPVSDSARA